MDKSLQANQIKIVAEPFIAGHILIETEYYQIKIAILDNYNEMAISHVPLECVHLMVAMAKIW